MKQVEVFQWYLPPAPGSGPRARPYLSRWKMSAKEAKARGATRFEPTSREVRQVAETPEEQREMNKGVDTSWLGRPRDH